MAKPNYRFERRQKDLAKKKKKEDKRLRKLERKARAEAGTPEADPTTGEAGGQEADGEEQDSLPGGNGGSRPGADAPERE